MTKSSYIVAQLGARMHYAVPRILEHAGMLERLYTDICADTGLVGLLKRLPDAFVRGSVRRLRARQLRGVPAARVTTFPLFGLNYLRRQRRARSISDTLAAYLWGGETFARLVVQRGFGQARGVYCFTSAGLELMEAARRAGLLTVLEQTSLPKSLELEIIGREFEVSPGWEFPPNSGSVVSEFVGREQAEWAIADVIVCPSEFVREGLLLCGVPDERIIVVPYGVALPKTDLDAAAGKFPVDAGRSLRVLTVGGVRLQKGTRYVFEAAQSLKGKCEFRMVGSVLLETEAQRKLRDQVRLIGPVPRSDVAEHYAWADVFLLPSLCEGSATVVYEALAHGLPVICTPNTGSVVRDGVDGFLVPIQNSEAIVQRLERLARDGELRARMACSARARAEEFTVEAYGQRLLAALRDAMPA